MRLAPSLLATALVLLQITAFAKHTKINSPAPARVFFEPNAGQADKAVRWLGRSGDSSLLLLDDGAVFLPQSGAQVRLKFDGAGQVTATGVEPQPGVSNYYRGSDAGRWQKDIPHYAREHVAGAYQGIDLCFYGKSWRRDC